jgi:hypothetical protein
MDYKEKVIALLNSKELSQEQKEKLESIFPELAEQKPTDKVEPKFKVDDWIINKTSNLVYRVESILLPQSKCYYLSHNGEIVLVSFTDEQNYRLWTIEDAKDGDVFATSAGAFIYNGNNGGGSCPGSYCGINTLGRFQTGVEHHWTGKKVYPATKEQYDALIKAMSDAGYTFDFEKKELMKIEQKPAGNSGKSSEESDVVVGESSEYKNGFECGKQYVLKYPEEFNLCKKPSEWSKEDESCYTSIMEHLKYSITNGKPETYTSGRLTDWIENRIKSLRPKSQWKPSKEQMKALDIAIRCGIQLGTWEEDALKSLYQKLTYKARDEHFKMF